MKDPGERRWDSADLARSRLRVELTVALAAFWAPRFAWGIWERVDPDEWTVPSSMSGIVWFVGATSMLLYLVWNRQGSLRPLGFRRTRWWAEPLWAVLIFMILVAADYFLRSQFWRLGWADDTPADVESPRGLLAALLLVYFLAGAFFEEVFVRGYLWDRLRRVVGGKTKALFLSAALFTSWHPDPVLELVNILAFGLILGLFFWNSRSLPRLILAHTAFNVWFVYS